MKHVARHVRVGILIDSQSCRSVLDKQYDYAVLFARVSQLRLNCFGELNQLLALM